MRISHCEIYHYTDVEDEEAGVISYFGWRLMDKFDNILARGPCAYRGAGGARRNWELFLEAMLNLDCENNETDSAVPVRIIP